MKDWIPSDLKSRLTSLSEKVKALSSDHPLLAAMLSGRQGRFALLAFTVALIWFVGCVRIYQPAAKELGALRKRVDKVNEKIQTMKKQIPDVAREQKVLEKKNEAVEALRVELHQVESRLPSRSELAPILEQLTTSEAGESLKVLSVKPVEEKTEGKRKKGEAAEPRFYPQEKFEIEMSTGFWEFVRYLARLEKVSPYFSFPKVEIRMDEKKEVEQPKVRLQVGILLREKPRTGKDTESIFKEKIPPFSFSGMDQDPFFSGTKAARPQASSDQYRVSGVIWKGGKKVAIINNEVVREGDKLGKGMIVSIDNSKIVLEQNGRQSEITIA